MAKYAINFNGSGVKALQTDIHTAADSLSGLSKQTQLLALSVAQLFSALSPEKLLGQTEKTVRKITTTVRKEAKKALLAFDEIQRIGGNTSVSTTSSVTTTTADTANVTALAEAYKLLEQAVTAAMSAVEADGVVQELASIRTAVEEVLRFLAQQTYTESWTGQLEQATEGVSGVKSALDGLAAFSGVPAIQMITVAVGEAITSAKAFLQTWRENMPGFSQVMDGIVNKLKETFSGADQFLMTHFPGLCNFLQEKMQGFGTEFQRILEVNSREFQVFLNTFSGLARQVAEAFGTLVRNIFTADWTATFGMFGGALEGFVAGIKNSMVAAKQLLSSFSGFVSGVFYGNWFQAWQNVVSALRGVWMGLTAGLKNPINVLIGYLNGLIGGVTSGINSMISALNGIRFRIPSWVPVLGGKGFDLNLSPVSAPKIPYLAQGAVLPANKPFMAVVGDQKHGTNVEAPLDTIRQALMEVMQAQPEREIVLNFSGDLAQLGRVLRPVIEAENRRVGTSLIRKGAF